MIRHSNSEYGKGRRKHALWVSHLPLPLALFCDPFKPTQGKSSLRIRVFHYYWIIAKYDWYTFTHLHINKNFIRVPKCPPGTSSPQIRKETSDIRAVCFFKENVLNRAFRNEMRLCALRQIYVRCAWTFHVSMSSAPSATSHCRVGEDCYHLLLLLYGCDKATADALLAICVWMSSECGQIWRTS